MAEVTAPKSSPEPKNDQSDSSMNIATDKDGGTSEQASFEMPIATTSKDTTSSDSTSKIKDEPQTSTGRGPLYQHLFSDSDEDGSNDINDLYRFSDNDFAENDESTSSDNYESNHEGHVDIDEDCLNTIISSKTGIKDENILLDKMTKQIMKTMMKGKNKKSDKMNDDQNTTSSDEEGEFLLKQIASLDGGESSKTKLASAGSWNDELDLSSSDEEVNRVITHMKAVNDGGECSKTKRTFYKMEDPLKEKKDESLNDDDVNKKKTTDDGDETSNAEDIVASLSIQKNESSNDEGAPSDAKSNDDMESIKTEVAVAGPSNEGQAQIKPPTKNKAERKMFILPFKKYKKF